MPAQASDQRGLNAGTEVECVARLSRGETASTWLQPPLASSAAPRVRRRFWRVCQACVRRVATEAEPKREGQNPNAVILLA